MADGNPFVAEVAVDLEDPLEAADHQPLQIELRGDAQEELHIQGIVMGHEGPGRRAAGDRLHHRCFHFEEIVGSHEFADQVDDPGALDENLPHLGVDDQVDIALPVTGLHVGQAVEFLRQGQKRLGQEPDRGDMQGEFAGLGPERDTRRADDIADVEGLEIGKDLVTDGVLLHVELDPPLPVLHLDKGGLAEGAAGNDPAGHRKCRRIFLDGFLVTIGVHHISGGVLRPEIIGIGIYPRLPERIHLASSLQQQLAQLFHDSVNPFLRPLIRTFPKLAK